MDDLNKIISHLEYSPSFLEKLIEGIPEEKLKTRRKRNRWSAHEHACHVCMGEKYAFHKRFELFQNEKDPVLEPVSGSDFSEDFYLNLNMTECLDEFKLLRDKTVKLIKESSDELLNREADHPEYIKYTPLIMIKHLIMHDHFHFYYIEELLLAREGCLEVI